MLKHFSPILARILSLAMGVLFLAVGLYVRFEVEPTVYDASTTATISRIDEYYELVGDENELRHDVYVDYTVDGKDYTDAPLFSYKSSMHEGDTMTLYYVSEDPTQISDSEKDAGPTIALVFIIVGGLMTLVDLVLILRRLGSRGV